MRRTTEEVKNELIKRKSLYIQKQARLRKSIIATTVCAALIIGIWAAAIVLPANKPFSPPSDSHDNVIVVDPSKEQMGSNGGLTESNDSSVGESGTESSAGSADTSGPNPPDYSQDISVPDPPDYSQDISVPGPPDYSQDISQPDNPRIEMMYPTVLKTGKSVNLTKPLTVTDIQGTAVDTAFTQACAKFAAELLKGCADSEDNVVLSPFSMMAALGMIYNGAEGTTKTAMQKALGGLTVEQFNLYMHSFLNGLPNSEDCYVNVSNAIWASDKYGINKYFLQDCVDYYGADVFMAHFTELTKDEINSWISEKTDGQITEMLDAIDPNGLAYLVNALDFEALWIDEYKSYQVFTSEFTNANGSVCDVELMFCSDWRGKYIETDDATGFIKPYKNGYSFVALLPKDKHGLKAMVSSMTGDKLVSAIDNAFTPENSIETYIPKFSTSCNISSEKLESVLSDMGMGVAFDEKYANFSKMFDPSCIESVLHSTTITVDQLGTKASSATVLNPAPTAAPVYATVRLDRPFMYAIIENQSNIPLFIGTVTNLS